MSGAVGPGEGIPGGTAGIGRGGGKDITGDGAMGAITGNGRAKAGGIFVFFACCFALFLVFVRSPRSRIDCLDDGFADERVSLSRDGLLSNFRGCPLFEA